MKRITFTLLAVILVFGLISVYPNPAEAQQTVPIALQSGQPPAYLGGGLNFASGGHLKAAVQIGGHINMVTIRDEAGKVQGQVLTRATVFISEYGAAPDSANDIKAVEILQLSKAYFGSAFTAGIGAGGRIASSGEVGSNLVGIVEFGWRLSDAVEVSINGTYIPRDDPKGDEFLIQGGLSINWPKKT